MRLHEQVKVPHPDRGLIEVDRGIAELLVLLWQLQISTVMSCERQFGDWIWIEFEYSYDVERFLTLITMHHAQGPIRPGGHTLYERMTVTWYPGSWRYSVIASNTKSVDSCVPSPSDDLPQFLVTVDVRFPCTDYQQVLDAMREASAFATKPLKAAEHP